MIGQGRPTDWATATARPTRRLVRAARWAILFAICFLAGAAPVVSEELKVRLRIEWGGGAERIWQGSLTLTAGRLGNPLALGLEADGIGAIFDDQGRIVVRSHTSRVYDGIDVSVEAPRDAALRVELAPADESSAVQRVEIPLAQLLDDFHNSALDNRGNRLLVRRTPGDKLRVIAGREHLIFVPGETWNVGIQPALPNIAAASKVRLASRLVASDNSIVWNDEREWTSPSEGEPAAPIALPVKMPNAEGVYDLVLQVSRRNLTGNLTDRFGLRPVSDERRVQVIVVALERSSYPAVNDAPAFDALAEIDPAQPAWWERFTAWPANLPRIPNLRRGPLGNGALTAVDHPLGKLAQLGPGGREPDTAWEAYPLPVARPGHPHMIEVEYPSNVAETLGLSVVEPNAAGIVTPIGLDSGVYQPPEAGDHVPTMQRHRLIFWPRTNSPLLLVTNRRHGSPAVYGKLRLLGPKGPAWSPLVRQVDLPRELPRAFPAGSQPTGRQLLAYYDRPLFPENFGAPQALDAASAASGRVLDDWNTFRVGGTRLVEYLQHVGYSGVMLSALADGSTIYPSELIEPTPRYDDGIYFATGQDPVRKDVLELVFRLCDREQLQLVPVLQLASRLPRLEQLKRASPETIGIDLVGSDGQPWTASRTPRQGLAPYYNPLHPQVQQAMLDVVAEVVERYAQHPSFSGVTISMTADGYAQFPGAEWGLDALTLASFEQETGVKLGEAGDDHAGRAIRLITTHRASWLAWRAQKLGQWYQHVGAYIAGRKPGAKLYLATGDLLHRSELERELRPALPKKVALEQLWAAVGIDPAQLRASPEITLLRPQRVAPVNSLTSAAADLEFNAASEWDAGFADPDEPGWLFFHPPQETRLASFEAKSPFRKTHLRIVAQPSPGGALDRQRFAHALARHDAVTLADGGWLLPLGQEDELRDLVATYRNLPRAKFETLPSSTQPVTIRTYADSRRSYLYLVNDSPWKAAVTLAVQSPAGCRLDPLGVPRRFPPLQGDGEQRWWTIDLAPYDVVAGVFSSPEARVSQPSVRLPNQAGDGLDARIGELWARAAALKNPPPSQLVSNADFEVSVAGTLLPANWEVIPRAGSQVKLDENQRHGGRYGLQVTAGTFGAEIQSRVVAVPPTGRLSLAMWLRVADDAHPPTVRVGVEGDQGGREWSRAALLGSTVESQRLQTTWTQYVFEVPDLPSDTLRDLRITIDVVGSGQVWIDDLEMLELDFSETERLELSKVITTIEYQRKSGELAECLRMLEGYWPRFLRTYVPLGDQPVVRSTIKSIQAGQKQVTPTTPATTPPDPARSGTFERFKRFIPRWSR